MTEQYRSGFEELAKGSSLYPQESLVKIRKGKKSLFIGIPKEGYCFSNNVKPKLKAPSFEDTKVWIDSDTTITVEMNYWGDK